MEEKVKLVQEIINKAVTISETTKATVFIYYFGHVNTLKCSIHSEGWEKSDEPDYRLETYVKENEYTTKNDIMEKLYEISNKLDEYLGGDNNE